LTYDIAKIAAELRSTARTKVDGFLVALDTPNPQTWRLSAKNGDWYEYIEFRPFGNSYAMKLDQLCKSIGEEVGRRLLNKKLSNMMHEHKLTPRQIESMIIKAEIDVADYPLNITRDQAEVCITWMNENIVELRLSTSFTSTDP
jgi:hypothetical protein